MNSTGIRWAAIIILGVSFAGFFFGASLPIPLMAKFFLGAFGFGTGVVLLIVSKVLRIKENEGPEGKEYENGHDDSE